MNIPFKHTVVFCLLLLTALYGSLGYGRPIPQPGLNQCAHDDDGFDWCGQCHFTPREALQSSKVADCPGQGLMIECRVYWILNGTQASPSGMFFIIQGVRNPGFIIKDDRCDPTDPLAPCHQLILTIPFSSPLFRRYPVWTFSCNSYDSPPLRASAFGAQVRSPVFYPPLPDSAVSLTLDETPTLIRGLFPPDNPKGLPHVLYRFAVNEGIMKDCSRPTFTVEHQTADGMKLYRTHGSWPALLGLIKAFPSPKPGYNGVQCIDLHAGPLAWGQRLSVTLECRDNPGIAYPLGTISREETLEVAHYDPGEPMLQVNWRVADFPAVMGSLWLATNNGERPGYARESLSNLE